MAHEFEQDEWRGAVAELTELERAESCGHYWCRGVCVYCGEVAYE